MFIGLLTPYVIDFLAFPFLQKLPFISAALSFMAYLGNILTAMSVWKEMAQGPCLALLTIY